jgi:hypothetical protein
MEADAFEIRLRAERRTGEMMAPQRETVGFNPAPSSRTLAASIEGGSLPKCLKSGL